MLWSGVDSPLSAWQLSQLFPGESSAVHCCSDVNAVPVGLDRRKPHKHLSNVCGSPSLIPLLLLAPAVINTAAAASCFLLPPPSALGRN